MVSFAIMASGYKAEPASCVLPLALPACGFFISSHHAVTSLPDFLRELV
jgi:hypothetical protein